MFFEKEIYFLGLFGVLFLLVLWFRYLRSKRKNRLKIGSPNLVLALTKSYNHKGFLLKNGLLLSSVPLLIFCLANLQSVGGSANITRSGVDILYLLDVSKSMLATDVAPSRLERAKHLLIQFSEKYPDNKYGLILFSGNAYMQMPLTSDLANAKQLIAAASAASVPAGGTQVDAALTLCQKAFGSKDKKYKVAILVSDGESHTDNSLTAAKQLKDSGVVVYTIGIGTTEGSTIIDAAKNDFKKDKDGNTVITKLNETVLKEIAGITNGKYIPFSGTEAVMENLSKDLALLGTKKITDKTFMRYSSYYQWFGLAALIVLSVSFFIPTVKKHA